MNTDEVCRERQNVSQQQERSRDLVYFQNGVRHDTDDVMTKKKSSFFEIYRIISFIFGHGVFLKIVFS